MGNRKAKRPPRQARPAKPREGFPLFAHACGSWAKKIAGRLHYFGPWSDPEGAERQYLLERDDLQAGRRPRPVSTGAHLTLDDAVNHFLHAKAKLRDSGELAARTWTDYERTAKFLLSVLGRSRDVADLGADDFVDLRARLAASGYGPVTISNEVQRIRTLFKYLYEAELVDRPVRFGPSFKRASKKTMRLARAQRGPKMFQAAEIHELLALAGVHMRAMILLGINLGYGNNDCGRLPLAAVDLDHGWIRFPRPKTGIGRRGWLWPETVKALRASLAKRKPPKPPAEGLFFVTKRGLSWSKESSDAPVSKEFTKLLNDADAARAKQKRPKLRRPGVNFYALRHTFRTVADAAGDQPAADLIMGHARDDMANEYREMIDDDRLVMVAKHVRKWLFPPKKKTKLRRS